MGAGKRKRSGMLTYTRVQIRRGRTRTGRCGLISEAVSAVG